jgi:hypothetical protein
MGTTTRRYTVNSEAPVLLSLNLTTLTDRSLVLGVAAPSPLLMLLVLRVMPLVAIRAAAHGHGLRQLGGRERGHAEDGDDRENGEAAVKA